MNIKINYNHIRYQLGQIGKTRSQKKKKKKKKQVCIEKKFFGKFFSYFKLIKKSHVY